MLWQAKSAFADAALTTHDVADANAGGDERAKMDFLREVGMMSILCSVRVGVDGSAPAACSLAIWSSLPMSASERLAECCLYLLLCSLCIIWLCSMQMISRKC